MYFYVDESGNSGSNQFDPNQPCLHYGVLGCAKNLDIIAEPMLARLRKELGARPRIRIRLTMQCPSSAFKRERDLSLPDLIG